MSSFHHSCYEAILHWHLPSWTCIGAVSSNTHLLHSRRNEAIRGRKQNKKHILRITTLYNFIKRKRRERFHLLYLLNKYFVFSKSKLECRRTECILSPLASSFQSKDQTIKFFQFLQLKDVYYSNSMYCSQEKENSRTLIYIDYFN